MMKKVGRKKNEEWFYKPLRKLLEARFKSAFGNCYLEITHKGKLSEKIKSAIPSKANIIFSFLRGKTRPDLTGFVEVQSEIKVGNTIYKSDKKWCDFIIIEVKPPKIDLKDIYQAKRYADLFQAEYGFLMTMNPIPEEIKRLASVTSILSIKQGNLRIAQFNAYRKGIDSDESVCDILEDSWFPDNPFEKKEKYFQF